MKKTALILALLIPLICQAAHEPPRGPVRQRETLDQPNLQNWVQESGTVRMNITNWGYLGNDGSQHGGAMVDPCPPGTEWAPQCEFPAGSGQQYLFHSGLWIGAEIWELGGNWTPRLSVGTDGWFNPPIHELYPGEGEEAGLDLHSDEPGATDCFGNDIYDPSARANQELIAVYSDTLHDHPIFNEDDPIDGPHRPLGVEVTQKSLTWYSPDFSNFVILEYTVRNIGNEFLRSVYLGLYCDIDTGPWNQFERHTDDITGFLVTDPATGDTVNIAWIADNDGRPPQASSGPFDNPHAAGVIVLSPNETGNLRRSFNWWISNGNVDLDYGPAWEAYAHRDSLNMGWTDYFGTPVGDEHKYQIMSNGEFDFDQVHVDDPAYIDEHPQDSYDPVCRREHNESWSQAQPADNASDLADGFDTRFLYSWGPVGVFDYTDGSGCDVYRLSPGEEFTFAVAYILGADFHDPDHPQPSNTDIDPTLFDYSGLVESATQARAVFDQLASARPPVDQSPVPRSITLHQNYPNPFNPITRIPFEIDAGGHVTIELFNLAGQRVATPVDEYYPSGVHEVIVDGSALPSGIYFYRLSAGDALRTRKMVLLK